MIIQEKKYPYLPEKICDVLSDSAKSLGWLVISVDNQSCSVKARTSGSLRSWGEEVSAKAWAEGGGMAISVKSEAPYQFIDWGKNEENEKMFLQELDKKLKR